MTMVNEPERLELHRALRDAIGQEPANTFMQLAPPRDWDQIVRVHQLDAAIGGLRTELKQDIADVRLEIAGLREELKLDIAGLRGEVTGLLSTEIRRQTQWIIGVLTSLSIALILTAVL